VIADKKKLGKSGSDSKNKKLTFVSLYGLQKAKDIADKVYKEAFFALKKIKGKREKLDLLKEMTEFILRRDF
jgi:geranylgeranyl diphosphate synthase type II